MVQDTSTSNKNYHETPTPKPLAMILEALSALESLPYAHALAAWRIHPWHDARGPKYLCRVLAQTITVMPIVETPYSITLALYYYVTIYYYITI